MITPAEIRKKANRQYATFLSAVLTRKRFFPLEIKGNKGKASDSYEKIFREIKRLLESEKQKVGYGYTVSLKTVNTRHAGKISMPDKIYFENVEDYVKFIEKEEEFLAFRKAAQLCRKKLPELQKWIAENPLKVIKNLAIWSELVEVAAFFLENPQPNIYAREIPLSGSATFVENQQAILSEILEAILPQEHINEKATIFEKRFGLKYDLPLVRIRSLSGNLSNFPVADVSLSLNDWTRIVLDGETVFIISDKLNFLRFPVIPNAIAILGSPKIIEYLRDLSFLQHKKIYFWGDISESGFLELSTIRKAFSQTTSLFMTTEILEKYEALTEKEKTTETIISHLTPSEQAVLTKVRKEKSLMGKHILQEDIENELITKKLITNH